MVGYLTDLGGNLKKENFGSYVMLMVMGGIMIIFHEKIYHIFPYIIGAITILIAIGFIKNSIREREYKKAESKRLAYGIVMFIMGTVIIINQSDSINLIAIIWGIFGLIRGADELGEAIYNHSQGKKWILELVHGIVEMALAILLIYHPFEKISEHIIILGLEYVILSLQLFINPKMVPKKARKNFLLKKKTRAI